MCRTTWIILARNHYSCIEKNICSKISILYEKAVYHISQLLRLKSEALCNMDWCELSFWFEFSASGCCMYFGKSRYLTENISLWLNIKYIIQSPGIIWNCLKLNHSKSFVLVVVYLLCWDASITHKKCMCPNHASSITLRIKKTFKLVCIF